MPTYILDDPSRPLHLPAGPITIMVRATGTQAAIELTATAPVEGLIRPAPYLVVVPAVAEATTVRVTPVGAERFPTPATIAVTIEARGGGAEPERVQLATADVSGLTHRDMVVVEPQGHRLVVTLVTTMRDEDLPDLVMHARAAARKVLEVDRVADAEALAVTIAIDSSASMRAITDAAVTATISVILGLSCVVGPAHHPVRVGVLGAEPTWLEGVALADIPTAASEALARAPQTVGMRWAQGSAWRSPGSRAGVVYMVTDALPADLAQVEALAAAADVVGHVVVVGSEGEESRQVADHVALTGIAVDRAVDLGTFWTEHPQQLSEVVRRLLRASSPSGSDMARRISR